MKPIHGLLRQIPGLPNRLRHALAGFFQPEDPYTVAVRKGAVRENNYTGMGKVYLYPVQGKRGCAVLEEVATQFMWVQSVVLDTDTPESVAILSVSVGGRVLDIGEVLPISAFAPKANRYGFPLGHMFIGPGQTVRVIVESLDPEQTPTVVGGLIADELDPTYAATRLSALLLQP